MYGVRWYDCGPTLMGIFSFMSSATRVKTSHGAWIFTNDVFPSCDNCKIKTRKLPCKFCIHLFKHERPMINLPGKNLCACKKYRPTWTSIKNRFELFQVLIKKQSGYGKNLGRHFGVWTTSAGVHVQEVGVFCRHLFNKIYNISTFSEPTIWTDGFLTGCMDAMFLDVQEHAGFSIVRLTSVCASSCVETCHSGVWHRRKKARNYGITELQAPYFDILL